MAVTASVNEDIRWIQRNIEVRRATIKNCREIAKRYRSDGAIHATGMGLLATFRRELENLKRQLAELQK